MYTTTCHGPTSPPPGGSVSGSVPVTISTHMVPNDTRMPPTVSRVTPRFDSSAITATSMT